MAKNTAVLDSVEKDVICRICKKGLDVDFRVVEYNGRKEWICKTHRVPKVIEKND